MTDHKCLNAGVSTAPWLATGHLLKEEPQLRVEQLDILTTEDLGHKVATISEHMGSDVQCLQWTMIKWIFMTIHSGVPSRGHPQTKLILSSRNTMHSSR